MSKTVKSLLMKNVEQKMRSVEEVFFVDLSKLDGVSSNRMRVASRAQSIGLLGGPFKLARRSLTNLGWNLSGGISGAATVVWGGDVVRLAKSVIKWEKDFPGVVVKGGYVGGRIVTPEQVKTLSESPSKEELISGILGGLLAASTGALGAISAPGSLVASQVKQISEKGEG